MKRMIAVTAACLALLIAAPTLAQKLPEYYPEQYEIIGKLNGINSQAGYIVILDMSLPIHPAVRVYTTGSRFETLGYLRPGMTVGVSRESRHEPVADIWVLPDGYTEE